jgi:hypothetical protein
MTAAPRQTQRAAFTDQTRLTLLENDVDEVYSTMHDIAEKTNAKVDRMSRIGMYILVSIVIGCVLALINLVR